MVQKKKKAAVGLSRASVLLSTVLEAMVEVQEAYFLDKLRMSLRTAVSPHPHH